MAYKKIETAAFIPVPGAGPFLQTYSALRFPPAVARGDPAVRADGKKDPDRYQQVPIGSLNAAIRALAPDLVSVATRAATLGGTVALHDERVPGQRPAVPHPELAAYRQPSPDAFRALTDTTGSWTCPRWPGTWSASTC